jgi:hypothetical protein
MATIFMNHEELGDLKITLVEGSNSHWFDVYNIDDFSNPVMLDLDDYQTEEIQEEYDSQMKTSQQEFELLGLEDKWLA